MESACCSKSNKQICLAHQEWEHEPNSAYPVAILGGELTEVQTETPFNHSVAKQAYYLASTVVHDHPSCTHASCRHDQI